MEGQRTVNYMIRAVSDDKGLVKISREFQKLSKNVEKTTSNVSMMGNVMRTALAYFGIREITQSADEFQQLYDRIKVFTGSGEEATRVFGMIRASAAYAKTSVSAIAETYNRVALAMGDANLSSEALLGLSVSLQQSFRLAGSTIAEATSSTIQLTQGLASGQVRGQELRSVLEGNNVIGGLLADTMSKYYKRTIERGQLMRYAEKGMISADLVVKSLADSFDKLDKSAGQLKQTFGQSITLALDAFRFKIFEIVNEFDLNGKFARGISFLTNNMRIFAVVLSSAVVPALGMVIGQVRALTLAMLSNPWTAALTALTTAAAAVYLYWDEISLFVRQKSAQMGVYMAENFGGLLSLWPQIVEGAKTAFTFVSKIVGQVFDGLLYSINYWAGAVSNIFSAIVGWAKGLDATLGTNLFAKAETGLDGIISKLTAPADKTVLTTAKKDLEAINKEYAEFQKAQAEGDEGLLAKTLGKALKDAADQMKGAKIAADGLYLSINGLWKTGKIGVTAYNAEVSKIKSDELRKQFDQGKISVDQYYSSLIKVRDVFSPSGALFVGTQNYIDSIGNLSTNVAEAITHTFSTLEDTLVEFTKNGKIEFRKFAQAILDDLTRIIIRASIVRPLASGIMAGFSGGAAAPTGQADYYDPSYSAKGNVFSNRGLEKFASGGVVNRTTSFTHAGGRGIMGEAGPEAILPLKRNSKGDLGVAAEVAGGGKVTVNIINNAGTEVTQEERTGDNGERILDVVIERKVNAGLATGKYDRTLGQAFGLQRRGV